MKLKIDKISIASFPDEELIPRFFEHTLTKMKQKNCLKDIKNKMVHIGRYLKKKIDI